MAKNKFDSPPLMEDRADFREYMLQLHSDVYGLGEETEGILDDDNLLSGGLDDYLRKDAFTEGSVLFRGSSEIDEDNTNFVWDDGNDTLDVKNFEGLQIITAKVDEVAGITLGQAVYVSGATGDKPTASLADNTLHNNSHTLGVAAETKANNQNIDIAIFGELTDVDTSGFTAEGDRMHLSTAGSMQSAIPTSGAHIHMGFVTKKDATEGIMFVAPEIYTHDIRATSDIDVKLATGSTDATRKIIFEKYDGTDIGFMNGLGVFQWGTAANYTEIEADGTIEFNGTATVFDDLRIPGLTVTLPAANAPDFGAFLGAGGLQIYLFDGAGVQTESVHFTIQIPHSYKEGSDIVPHVHWSAVNGNAGNVVWQLEYTWQNIDGTFPAVTTITVTDAASGTAWDHQKAFFSAITGTGKTISSMLVCRLFRDPTHASDTYGSDAAFLEIDFHFEKDTVGSRQITTK
jgi:hypothetical protein